MKKIFSYLIIFLFSHQSAWCRGRYSSSYTKEDYFFILILVGIICIGVIYNVIADKIAAKRIALEHKIQTLEQERATLLKTHAQQIYAITQERNHERYRANHAIDIARQSLSDDFEDYKDALAEDAYNKQQELILKIKTYEAEKEKLAKDRSLISKEKFLLTSKLQQAVQIMGYSGVQKYLTPLQKIIQYLTNKQRPAYTAAEVVRAVKKELRQLKQEHLQTQYIINTYEHLFPWLPNFKEMPTEALLVESEDDDEDRQVNKYLSANEKSTLSRAEKFQKALDRYEQSYDKSNWHIGLFYERYIGYLYETKGWKISMNGAKKRLEDMGIDLIATLNGKTEIVQCKYWAQDKTIYEKYIFQLFGTTINYIFEQENLSHINPIDVIKKKIITPVFVTSTELSPTAKRMANILGVIVWEKQPLDKNYPKIKCNPQSAEGEKIYHLPFDAQYDVFQVSQTNGAFYAKTIKEVEDKGFRRAYKWHGHS